jgi:hypothetical protein
LPSRITLSYLDHLIRLSMSQKIDHHFWCFVALK